MYLLNMRNFEEYKKLCTDNNYVLSTGTSHPYNINIVGWRDQKARVGRFDCFLSVYHLEDDIWKESYWPITTYPGRPALLRPVNKDGAAILVPGQYLNAYRLGVYKGYVALKQVRPVKVYRDKNLDTRFTLDADTIQEGLFGIHIHKASFWSKRVGVSSAGCQVFQRAQDYEEFMAICDKAAMNWGNLFTYTLVEF